MLKLYNESLSDFTRTIPPLAIFIPETKSLEYEVENILDKRVMCKKPQYLVKWLDYPLHDAIWEPLKNLANANKKVKKFELMRTSNLKEERM